MRRLLYAGCHMVVLKVFFFQIKYHSITTYDSLYWQILKLDLFLRYLNSLHAFFYRGNKNIYLHFHAYFSGEQKHICTFYVISLNWHDTGSWNSSSSKTRTYLFYLVNIMGADVLATQGSRASATIIFTMLSRIDSVPARQTRVQLIHFISLIDMPCVLYMWGD